MVNSAIPDRWNFFYLKPENLQVSNAGKKIPGGSEKYARWVKNYPGKNTGLKTLNAKTMNKKKRLAALKFWSTFGWLSMLVFIDTGIYQSGIFAITYQARVAPYLQSWRPA